MIIILRNTHWLTAVVRSDGWDLLQRPCCSCWTGACSYWRHHRHSLTDAVTTHGQDTIETINNHPIYVLFCIVLHTIFHLFLTTLASVLHNTYIYIYGMIILLLLLLLYEVTWDEYLLLVISYQEQKQGSRWCHKKITSPSFCDVLRRREEQTHAAYRVIHVSMCLATMKRQAAVRTPCIHDMCVNGLQRYLLLVVVWLSTTLAKDPGARGGLSKSEPACVVTVFDAFSVQHTHRHDTQRRTHELLSQRKHSGSERTC